METMTNPAASPLRPAALLAAAALAALLSLPALPGAEGPERGDVVWRSPSDGPAESLPLGNGDVAINAWIEKSGDLRFTIAKTDAWGDNARLLKVGRVRVSLEPSPLEEGAPFEERLSLADATLRARFGRPERAVELALRVDANRPAVVLEIESEREVTATSRIELWRTQRTTLPSIEVSDVLLERGKPGGQHAPTVVEPDTVIEALGPDRIGWYHHNRKSVGPALMARIQDLDLPDPDPLLHRTFGAIVTAGKGRRIDDTTLRSGPARRHRFAVHVLTLHPSSPREWTEAATRLALQTDARPPAELRRAHEAWWRAFWARSHIRVSAGGAARPEAAGDAAAVDRAYLLQRYLNASAGRGRYPIKFNGSLFTVEWPGKPGGPDYRRWGPGYWWQNTRLPYISMCTSGDFDLLEPFFRMYTEEILPASRQRARRYCGHEGALFAECVMFWGPIFSETYGWKPARERGEDKLQTSGWHKWEWVAGPELVWMMLDAFDHTLDERFLRERVLPTAREVLLFFDRHYPTGPDGRLVMHPAQALETYWDCTDPMPEIAGLHGVVDRLRALPARLTSDEDRAFWTRLKAKLPELPTREVDGRRMLAPAARFAQKRNIENPELYAVFPFRRVAIGRPNLELGLEAWRRRLDRGNFGWRQEEVFAAYLGLAEEARAGLVGRARKKNPQSRFPAFWGPNYDWVPDQDHGGILLKALQAMAMQCDPVTGPGEGGKIYLLPAWPRDWDVDFRLYAPRRTTVECVLRGGRIERLDVSPPRRRSDVVLPAGLGPPASRKRQSEGDRSR